MSRLPQWPSISRRGAATGIWFAELMRKAGMAEPSRGAGRSLIVSVAVVGDKASREPAVAKAAIAANDSTDNGRMAFCLSTKSRSPLFLTLDNGVGSPRRNAPRQQ